MEELPIDVLRTTALKLPLLDIFKFCRSNKRFQQYICNYKPFWEALLLRETNEVIEVSQNTPIDWYKEKIKEWPSIRNLVRLIRGKEAGTRYIQPFSEKWNSFEIVENIRELYCQNNQLTSLPSMSKLQVLNCDNNRLTSLPPMPKLQQLICSNNKLTSLSTPNLIMLDCRNNQLASLPPMPNLQYLWCENNPLPGFTLEYWQKVWKL